MDSRIALIAAAGLLLAGLSAHAASTEAFSKSADGLEWGGCPAFMPEGCEIAVLQGDPGQPNADIFFRVPAGAEIPRHWHHSPERMMLVSGELEVTYDGQEPVVLTPGTYAYGPAEKPHVATCRSAEPCLLFIAFEGPVDAIEGAPE